MKAGSVLVVGALVALAACSKDEKAAEASVTPGEGIAGQLTVLGVPVAGATVTLDGATPVMTDASGAYAFPNARAGSHALGFTAPGAVSDGIPTVLYSPETGASVPAPYSYEALYQLGTFDLQAATRLASVNVKAPARIVTLAPTLSPDGAFYVYGTTNDLGLMSLYVGSTAGGAPALVTDEAFPYSGGTRFAPDSSYLTFVKRTPYGSQYELFAAVVGAGPVVSSVTKVREFQPSFPLEFSPHTSGNPKSIYFIAYDTTNAVYSLVEQNINGGEVNQWLGVTQFWVAKQAKRVVFQQAAPDNADADALPQHRFVSVAATGANVGTTVVTYEGGTSNPYNVVLSWHGFSPDDSRFAYSVQSQDAGGTATLGLKSASVSSASPVRLEAGAASCVSFNPAGDRLAWTYGGALKTSPALSASVTTYVTTAASPFACPTFTSDGRIWLSYAADAATYDIGLAPADNSTPVISLATVVAAELRSVYFGRAGAAWIRGTSAPYSLYGRALGAGSVNTLFEASGNDAALVSWAPSGVGGFYRKLDVPYASNGYSLHAVGFAGANPTAQKVADRYYALSVSPGDQGKAMVWAYEEAGNYLTLTGVDVGTATPKPLLRRVPYGNALIQDVGTPRAAKVTAFRVNSPMPFEFQDGVYLAEP